MNSNNFNKRREDSNIKPIIYLCFQLIMLYVMYYITTTTVAYENYIFNFALITILFLVHRTAVVIKRTKPQRSSNKTNSVSSKKLSLSSLIIK